MRTSKPTSVARGTSIVEYSIILASVLILLVGSLVIIGHFSTASLDSVTQAMKATPAPTVGGVVATPTPGPAAPVADFAYSLVGTTLTLTDTSTGVGLSRTWYIGATGLDDHGSPISTTLSSGSHEIQVYVTDTASQSSLSAIQTVLVP